MFDNLISTTIVATVYDAGTIIAADKQGTMMPTMDKLPYEVTKIVQLSGFTMAGVAGLPKMLEVLGEVRRVFESWEKLYGREVSPDGQFNFLKQAPLILPIGKEGVASSILMAAFAHDTGKGRVFSFAPSFAMEVLNYAAIGSGGEACLSSLELCRYRTDMSFEEAVRQVANALRYSHGKNAGVGGKFLGYRLDAGGMRDISVLLNSREA
ncbi:MAG: hypothetical protein AAB378_03280 [Patescibacteria group bacterium]